MHYLILAHVDDATALRVHAALCARHGTRRVWLVSAEELVLAPSWVHQLDTQDGDSRVQLGNGLVLSHAAIGVVFNRLRTLPLPHFRQATAADRAYAHAEMGALLWSWLASLPCCVVNPPAPGGIGIQARSRAAWLLLAAQAGLPVQRYQFSSDPRRFHPTHTQSPRFRAYRPAVELASADGASPLAPVAAPLVGRQPAFYLEEPISTQQDALLVAGERVLGARAATHADAARQLARLSGCDLLQIQFAHFPPAAADDPAAGGWKVCAVQPFPTVENAAATAAIADLLDTRLQQRQTAS